MKKGILIFLLVFISLGFSQKVVEEDILYFFRNTNWQDSVYIHPDSGYYVLSTPTTESTFISRNLELVDGGGDLSFYMRVWNQSGTLNTKIYFGAYHGPEYGWEWYEMAAFTSPGRAKFSIPETSWGPFYHIKTYAIKIVESGTQSNYYAIRQKYFRWK